jgi:hypothetical protein
MRFLNILDLHGANRDDLPIERRGEGIFRIGEWQIECNLTERGKPALRVTHTRTGETLDIDDSTLKDRLPELEI